MLKPGMMVVVSVALGAVAVTIALLSPIVDAAPMCPLPRFTVNDGWVLDAETKLVWQQAFRSSKTWDEANSFCVALGNNARLPSYTELQTIVDDTRNSPAIDLTAFPGTPSSYFWTSSAVFGSPSAAWGVHFSNGYTSNNAVTVTYDVRCVR